MERWTVQSCLAAPFFFRIFVSTTALMEGRSRRWSRPPEDHDTRHRRVHPQIPDPRPAARLPPHPPGATCDVGDQLHDIANLISRRRHAAHLVSSATASLTASVTRSTWLLNLID